MNFNFDLRHTAIFQAHKRSKIFLFKYADLISQGFLAIFILSLFFVFISIVNGSSQLVSIKASALIFLFAVVFWYIGLFSQYKIKRVKTSPSLQDAVADIKRYNIADFLDLEMAGAVSDTLKFCKRKKVPVNSSALLYSMAKLCNEANVVLFRLGIDRKTFLDDLKNYLEKIPKAQASGEFSEDFVATITDAAMVAAKRQKEKISSKEVLISLAKTDDFFKQVLVSYDLKPTDLEGLTSWLDLVDRNINTEKEFWSKENLARQGSLGKDWASGYTITLDQYSKDWRRVVANWKFKEITSHLKQIQDTEVILSRDNSSAVLVVGDSGSGRRSVLEAIAHRCYLGQSLPNLNYRRLVELDMVKLSASIQDFEKLEGILDRIFSEVMYAGNVILAIDNLENFVGQNMQKAGAVDITGILSKYLSMSGFKFIGISTYDGLHKNIEQAAAFSQLLRKIEVPEITEEETIDILQVNALEAEYRSRVFVLYPAIREIVNLTARYMPSQPFPEKALDILNEAVVFVQSKREKVVFPHHIAQIVADKTQIPVGKMEVKEKETLLNLEGLIHERLVNQEEAVKEISVAMRRARAGLGSKTRPMGSFLFLGPTGVGKTETSKALAQIYFGGAEKMIRIDMSEFQAISDIPRLLGATSPVEMQGLLTTPVRETPFSLVLLDEIEKAHPNILNLFLQVLDEGHITDGQGRKVVFTNTIIICTSNAGADMIFKAVESGQPLVKDDLLATLFDKGMFRPEFVNRFDATVIFHPLTKENLLDIAQLSLKSLQKNLKEKEINFEITEPLKSKIVELSYKPAYGAREMLRVIQDNVENVVAQALLSDKIKKGDKIEINPDNFELIINQ
ncbi:MAG TPA: ATP-dependent Clp protease ATP-binding subunit [Candidatus Staskawiczbacteria bacterium]|nr:ATP-dependent Clp protease ATP-binding subunit [Candidatus Staskawiczbacteria bacterium]